MPAHVTPDPGPLPLLVRRLLASASHAERTRGHIHWDLEMFWFVGANGWLDDDAPVDLLDRDPEAVVEAASHANDMISDYGKFRR